MADTYNNETGEIIEPQKLPAPPAPTAPNNLIFASADCAAVFGALSLAQGQMGNPRKTKKATVKGQTKQGTKYEYDYMYAPLEEVVDSIRKPMSEAKLIYRQFLASRDGQWVMRTIIAHESGQWFGCDYPIFTGRQEGAQGFASGVTYARRYGLMLALGIVAEDDDDANVADGRPAEIAGRGQSESPAPAAATPPRQQSRPQAAPTDAAKEEARRRYGVIREEIDSASTPEEVATILTSPAWAEMVKHVKAADPDKADAVLAGLEQRGHEKVALLKAPPAGGEDYAA